MPALPVLLPRFALAAASNTPELLNILFRSGLIYCAPLASAVLALFLASPPLVPLPPLWAGAQPMANVPIGGATGAAAPANVQSIPRCLVSPLSPTPTPPDAPSMS